MNRICSRITAFFIAVLFPLGAAGLPLYFLLSGTPAFAADGLLRTAAKKASISLISVDGENGGFTLNAGESYTLEFLVRDSGMTIGDYNQLTTRSFSFDQTVFKIAQSDITFGQAVDAGSGITYAVTMDNAVYRQTPTPNVTGTITMSSSSREEKRTFSLDLSNWIEASPAWDYELRDVVLYRGSNILSKVKRHDSISRMEVSIRDNAVTPAELEKLVEENNLKAHINSDVFRDAGTPTVEDIIATNSGVSYTLVFRNLEYTGKGNVLRLTVDYLNGDEKLVPTRIFNETIEECEVYEKSSSSGDESSDPKIAPPTPNLIISSYNYGGGTITAASNVSLDLTFTNTSRYITVDNIVMKVTMPEAFMLTNSTNTFYFERLGREEAENCSINFSVKPNAEPISHAIKVSFSFECVMMDERKAFTGEQEISIPVSQLNRITLNPVEVPEQIYMGERGSNIEAKFVNKGKAEVYNVSLSIEGENLAQPGQTQFVGNLAGGKEDSVDFTIDGLEQGPITGEIVMTYEDANMNVSQLRTPFTTQAVSMDMGGTDNEGMFPPEPTEPTVAPPWYRGIPGWYWLVGGSVLAIMAAFSIRLARTVHVKKLEAIDDEDF